MDKFLIRGGKVLSGTVDIGGSKNATLPIMASTLLLPGRHTITGVPLLRDINTMSRLIETLGGRVESSDHRLTINTENVNRFEAPYELVRTMRASILVLGPLLARFKWAKVSLPGGCAIGSRPVNIHLDALRKMGAEIEICDGYIIARAERLRGAKVYCDIPTVTGTENIMMAAVLAEGRTVIENAAKEPEVVDLANALKKMGANIKGAGGEIIEIEGVNTLRPLIDYRVIPDRIEAGTFMAAVAITGGRAIIKNVIPEHIEAITEKLIEAGCEIISVEKDVISINGPEVIKPVNIKTMPYPGFPTDMQAQFMALMTVANGTSVIRETIFENRFMHVAELIRMGADITTEGSVATVKGVKTLKGAPLMSSDLRASASLVIAALRADGESIIDRVYHLDRGYERMELKLRAIGAHVERIK